MSPFDCREWRQGDVFSLRGLWIVDENGEPAWQATPFGVAVVSQSCDAAQRGRGSIQVAPVVILDGARALEASSGKRISFAALKHLGDTHFADLDTVVTLPKNVLGKEERVRGVIEDVHIRRFAGTVSRKYGRFAFPDEVINALDPLREVLRSKARREHSPLGRVLADIYGLRIEIAGSWAKPPFDLVLIIIFEPGVIPSFVDGELPDEPIGLRARIIGADGDIAKCSNQIAQELHMGATPETRHWLIMMLAESWAAQCEAAALQKGVHGVVRSVIPDVVTADEFPLTRFNNSEDLDLDYLSEPVPRLTKQPAEH